MRKAVFALVAVVLVICLAVGGICWYFAGQVVAVDRGEEVMATVIRSDASSVTLATDDRVDEPGTFGIRWNGGSAITDSIAASDTTSVTRGLRNIKGKVPTSGEVIWDREVWNGSPMANLGIAYEEVDVHSDLGVMPAWLIPGSSSTWVIAVHGRGGERDTALRILPTLQRSNTPVLVTSYRNDVGVPRSPDGQNHLGDTEWKDIDAAITYAKRAGAKNVVLYGWSMGGALTMTALQRSQQKDVVNGLILDAPVVDWRDTLVFQGGERNLPKPMIDIAMRMAESRGDLKLSDFTQKKYAPSLKVPVLVFHGEDDETVPVEQSKEFAAANPQKIRLELFPGASHTAEWNADRTRYEQAVSEFLKPLVPIPGQAAERSGPVLPAA